jgi:hypothetical protein
MRLRRFSSARRDRLKDVDRVGDRCFQRLSVSNRSGQKAVHAAADQDTTPLFDRSVHGVVEDVATERLRRDNGRALIDEHQFLAGGRVVSKAGQDSTGAALDAEAGLCL